MAFISRTYDFNTGDTLLEASLEGEFDALYNLLNGTTAGDISINGDLTVKGGDITVSAAATSIAIIDNNAASLDFKAGSDSFLKFVTTTDSEAVVLGQKLTVTDDAAAANIANLTGANASYTGAVLDLDCYRGSSSSFNFLVCTQDSDGTPNTAFSVAGNGQVYTDYIYVLKDGVSAPGGTAGQAKIYVDTSDGDLKVVFGDGHVATLAADS